VKEKELQIKYAIFQPPIYWINSGIQVVREDITAQFNNSIQSVLKQNLHLEIYWFWKRFAWTKAQRISSFKSGEN